MIPQRYVPVPEHDRGPLMLSRCAVTCENLVWNQPALLTIALLMLTLPRRPTTITSPSPRSHLPVIFSGTAVSAADDATPVTIAASTSRARTSPAQRSWFLLFIMVLPSTTRFPAARRLARSAEGKLRLR